MCAILEILGKTGNAIILCKSRERVTTTWQNWIGVGIEISWMLNPLVWTMAHYSACDCLFVFLGNKVCRLAFPSTVNEWHSLSFSVFNFFHSLFLFLFDVFLFQKLNIFNHTSRAKLIDSIIYCMKTNRHNRQSSHLEKEFGKFTRTPVLNGW